MLSINTLFEKVQNLVCFFVADFACIWEALHDFFFAHHIPWFLLPDQPDFGGCSHGL